MKNIKGIITVVIIAFALFGAVYLSQQTTFFSPKATTSYKNYNFDTNVPVIETVNGLEAQIQKMDGVNVDLLDEAMQENVNDMGKM